MIPAGLIALEEHFAIPETLGDSEQYAPPGSWEPLRARLLDLDRLRLDDMDEHGIAHAVVSLNSPGIQAIHDVRSAIDVARRANDVLAGAIARRPERFSGFAALPMQDVDAAAAELTRCVRELGFKGALVNGFSQVGSPETVVYYDAPEYLPFWAAVESLDVPFYLHPRDPLPWREPIYDAHPWFTGSAWAFAAETSMHALRLMGSGLFDRYPRLEIILGHLGEAIPYNVWRLDHRLKKSPRGIPARQTMSHYLASNFFLTTSGNFRTSTLSAAIAEVGVPRVMFSIDYPFEKTTDAVTWFSRIELTERDRLAIGRTTAIEMLRLGSG